MKEYLEEVNEEMKRADHLIFVSLKYTRTVDVIKNIIERFINAFNFMIDGLIGEAIEKGKITEVPVSHKKKVEELENVFPEDKKLKEYFDFYLMLRKISRARFDRAREFRRHVTMTAHLEDEDKEVNIDIIMEYNDNTKEFIEHVKGLDI